MREHRYRTTTVWTGDLGHGTVDYRSYGRDHVIKAEGKPEVLGSSDPAFRGDAARHNPEDLFVASLSACHMLWYLHLAAVSGVVVRAYEDDAEGVMEEGPEGGRFTHVILRPRVSIQSGDPALAVSLHEQAHRFCFIANSVSCAVRCEPAIEVMQAEK
ncbi:peroxiredoxin [Alsobacter soli]|uniref:Peroxiredoxin n=1 Tax=Alsobacter soli TaxID=2109933 RepID=A0A2T1HNJ7_9HYPH|nr:OsmC family protein [Alsobacter soli]PSC03240.1 peroxiredoxin [Alsobacter soli]